MTYDRRISSAHHVVSTKYFSLRKLQLHYEVFNHIVNFSRHIHKVCCLARTFSARPFNKDFNNRSKIENALTTNFFKYQTERYKKNQHQLGNMKKKKICIERYQKYRKKKKHTPTTKPNKNYNMRLNEYKKKVVQKTNIQQNVETQKAENKAFVCCMIRT